MQELLDERIIVTLMRSFQDFLYETAEIDASVEAYGPSKNEGVCYESCTYIDYHGDQEGRIYVAFDGYTRLKLLPVFVEKYRDFLSGSVDAESLMMHFVSSYASEFAQELADAELNFSLSNPHDCSHKIMQIELDRSREYIVIFFLRDRNRKKYLGRAYLVVTLLKFSHGEDDASVGSSSR